MTLLGFNAKRERKLYPFRQTGMHSGTFSAFSFDFKRSRWDIRKLQEPIEQLLLKEKNSDAILGGVSLEYDPAAGLTKFMIGTEKGAIHILLLFEIC